MIRKVAVLANCQGLPLSSLINTCLPGFSADPISNNSRTGNFTTDQEIARRLGAHDILVYQPLGVEHGNISDAALRADFPQLIKVRFPYIFNSGTTTLGYAPMSQKNSYGEVYGEDCIIEMINAGCARDEIARRIADGAFAPGVVERFNNDLRILAERESEFEIQSASFIERNYQEKHLFLTHNHPTFDLFANIFLQFVRAIEPHRLREARAGVARVSLDPWPI